MNTAHNTLIQFLHDRPEFSLVIERANDDWYVGLASKKSDAMRKYGYGPSYEAACASVAAQLHTL